MDCEGSRNNTLRVHPLIRGICWLPAARPPLALLPSHSFTRVLLPELVAFLRPLEPVRRMLSSPARRGSPRLNMETRASQIFSSLGLGLRP